MANEVYLSDEEKAKLIDWVKFTALSFRVAHNPNETDLVKLTNEAIAESICASYDDWLDAARSLGFCPRCLGEYEVEIEKGGEIVTEPCALCRPPLERGDQADAAREKAIDERNGE